MRVYITATGIVFGLVAIWAALVPPVIDFGGRL
jgi:hypothetical protein